MLGYELEQLKEKFYNKFNIDKDIIIFRGNLYKANEEGDLEPAKNLTESQIQVISLFISLKNLLIENNIK